MAKIIYIEHDGTVHAVDVQPGLSLMQGAVWNHIDGVVGACGGDGGCGTCHVYVSEPWRSRVGAMSAKERSTLRFAMDVSENSRLSCYIKVVGEFDGLVVRMPDRQY